MYLARITEYRVFQTFELSLTITWTEANKVEGPWPWLWIGSSAMAAEPGGQYWMGQRRRVPGNRIIRSLIGPW